jgi:hypothetical protein
MAPAVERNANVLDCADNKHKTVLLCGRCNKNFNRLYYCIARPRRTNAIFVCGRSNYTPVETELVLESIRGARVHLCHKQKWVNGTSGLVKTIWSVVFEFRLLGCTQRHRLCMNKSKAVDIFGHARLRVGTVAINPLSILYLDEIFDNVGIYGIYLWLDLCVFLRRVSTGRPRSDKRRVERIPQLIPECNHVLRFSAPTSPSTWHLRTCTACGYSVP